VPDTAFDRRVEDALRDRDLIFDERCHEEERVHTIEEGRVDGVIFEIERDDVKHVGKNILDRARCARADADLRPTRKQRTHDLSTYRARRPRDEDAH
jgi:hypothetical protein